MKKKTFILLISLIPLISNAQIFTSMQAGYCTKGSAIAAWSVGYDYKLINLQGEIRPSLTRKVESDNLIGLRLSVNLVNPDDEGQYFLPGVAYYYNVKSEDKTNLNKNVWAATLKSGVMVTEEGSVYLEGIYFKNTFQFAIGMQVNFHNREHLH